MKCKIAGFKIKGSKKHEGATVVFVKPIIEKYGLTFVDDDSRTYVCIKDFYFSKYMNKVVDLTLEKAPELDNDWCVVAIKEVA